MHRRGRKSLRNARCVKKVHLSQPHVHQIRARKVTSKPPRIVVQATSQAPRAGKKPAQTDHLGLAYLRVLMEYIAASKVVHPTLVYRRIQAAALNA